MRYENYRLLYEELKGMERKKVKRLWKQAGFRWPEGAEYIKERFFKEDIDENEIRNSSLMAFFMWFYVLSYISIKPDIIYVWDVWSNMYLYADLCILIAKMCSDCVVATGKSLIQS